MKQTIITAHSGCEGTPRDSLDSIKKALALNADAIEIDVRRSVSGALRCSHDPIAGDEESFAPLSAVFEMIRETPLQLNCDLKESSVLYGVLEMAARYGFGPERLTLTGCTSPEQMIRDERLRERASLVVNIEEVLKVIYMRSTAFRMESFPMLMNKPWDLIRNYAFCAEDIAAAVQCLKLLQPAAVNIPHRLLGTPLVGALTAAPFPLSVWTVDDPEIVRACLDLKVRNITTKQVQQALTLRDAA